MTNQEFENAFENLELDEQYAEFIMYNVDVTERDICNGITLTDAMDDEYLLEEFKASLVK